MEERTQIVGVVVVDDDDDARLCIEDMLLSAGGYNCIGSFSRAIDALTHIPKLSPDIVLMDIRLPDLSGIECTKDLRKAMPGIKIVMVSGMHDDDSIERALNAGANAYLVKPIAPDQYLATIKCLSISIKSREKPESELGGALPRLNPLLTESENAIMMFLAKGLLYKEISDKLKISYSAVHKHQHKIYKKLGATNRTEAIARWRG